MHSHRLITFVLGSWLLGTLLVGFFLSQSDRNVERVITSPPDFLAKEVEEIGHPRLRRLFEAQASNLNRHVREAWDFLQMGLGASLLLISVAGDRRNRVLLAMSGSMFALSLLFAFYLTPIINESGRLIEGLASTVATDARDSLTAFQLTRTATECLKVLLGTILAVELIRVHHRSRSQGLAETASGRVRRRIPDRSEATTRAREAQVEP